MISKTKYIYEWIGRVIDSCVMKEQLPSSEKLISSFKDYLKRNKMPLDVIKELEKQYFNKQMELC